MEHVTGYRERHAFSQEEKGSRSHAIFLFTVENFDDVMRSEKRSLHRSSGVRMILIELYIVLVTCFTIFLKWFCLVSFDLVSFALVSF